MSIKLICLIVHLIIQLNKRLFFIGVKEHRVSVLLTWVCAHMNILLAILFLLVKHQDRLLSMTSLSGHKILTIIKFKSLLDKITEILRDVERFCGLHHQVTACARLAHSYFGRNFILWYCIVSTRWVSKVKEWIQIYQLGSGLYHSSKMSFI